MSFFDDCDEFRFRPVADGQARWLSGWVIKHRELAKAEFLECSKSPMANVTGQAEAAVDIWPYIESLDLDSLRLPHINDVRYVYRDADARFDQALIGTGRFNTLLVIVVDLSRPEIHGHYLLDLNEEYGASGGQLRPVR